MPVVGAIDPKFVDLALALIALEGLGLMVWRRVTGAGPRPWALTANLAAGAFLLLVAKGLLTGASSLEVGAALTAALVAHGFDLAARWEWIPKNRLSVGPAARTSHSERTEV